MFLGILQNTRRGIGKRLKLLWLLVATKGYSAWRRQAWILLRCSAMKTGGQIFSAFPDCRRGGTVGETFDRRETKLSSSSHVCNEQGIKALILDSASSN